MIGTDAAYALGEEAFRTGHAAKSQDVEQAWSDYEPSEDVKALVGDPKLTLYLITSTSDDGENLDLFVWAESPAEAELAWAEYFDLNEGRPRIWTVPTVALSGPVPWHEVEENKL